ncbi:MAG: hypothetical protein PHQ43_12730, partial [Dehalococcoidales bacterium]|nr:hypothetical protein [Dehalococcoidales bacterium]
MYSQEEEGVLVVGQENREEMFPVYEGTNPMRVYDEPRPYWQTDADVALEIAGHGINEFANALTIMEDSIEHGEKAKVQMVVDSMPSQLELDYLYKEMIDSGFHTTKPVARMIDGYPTITMVLRKGSPVWAALIPLIPTVIVGGLVAFGITKIESISKALLPLLLVTVGGVIMVVALASREPVVSAAERALSSGALRRLPSTVPATAAQKKEAQSITLKLLEGPVQLAGQQLKITREFHKDLWDQADKLLGGWSLHAPERGYDKVEFIIDYGDKNTYHGRYDLRSWKIEVPNLAKHVYNMTRFRAGLWRGGMDEEQYQNFLKQGFMKKGIDEAKSFLEKYEIGELNPACTPNSPCNMPSTGIDYCQEARDAMQKYTDDTKAGHTDASYYWKGQAEVYGVLCAQGKQMFNYVTIIEPGDTVFTKGAVVSPEAFDKENTRVMRLGIRLAQGVSSQASAPTGGDKTGGSYNPTSREDLNYMADSPEYLAQTVDSCGWREQIDRNFQEAVG